MGSGSNLWFNSGNSCSQELDTDFSRFDIDGAGDTHITEGTRIVIAGTETPLGFGSYEVWGAFKGSGDTPNGLISIDNFNGNVSFVSSC